MASRNLVKIALLSGFVFIFFAFTISSNLTTVFGSFSTAAAAAGPDDYIGSESCKACHEQQFNEFSGTKHSQLAKLDSWKRKSSGLRIVSRTGQSAHGRRRR